MEHKKGDRLGRERIPILKTTYQRIFDFPQNCVVKEIYNRPNPCYHCAFLYDDEDDTIGRQAHSTAFRGPHPNPAQIPK